MNIKTIAISAAILAASAASAGTIGTIDRPDGQILLGDEPCPGGGRDATFIESRPGGGGAYGCWEERDGYVYIQWSDLLGPTGSWLRTNQVFRYPKPASMR